MDDIDRQLITLFQKEIPLKPRPFEVLGKGIGLHSADVMLRLHRLQEDGQAGRISALFDAEKLGYYSYSAVFRVPEEYKDQAAYYISGHPGVTQCIRRKGSYNFWFSIMLPVQESLEFHLGSLKEYSKAQKFLLLKTEKVFKPAVGSGSDKKAAGKFQEELTLLERKLIRALQEDFPLADDPYGRIAKAVGSSEELVIKQLQFFQKKGLLKKIRVLASAGSKKASGPLLLWNVPEEKIAEAGGMIAEFSQIRFCAQRASSDEMPYNLHVLAEDLAEEAVQDLIDKIERGIGMWPRQVLFKEKEEKRGRFKFFSKDIEDWRLLHEGQTASFFSA